MIRWLELPNGVVMQQQFLLMGEVFVMSEAEVTYRGRASAALGDAGASRPVASPSFSAFLAAFATLAAIIGRRVVPGRV